MSQEVQYRYVKLDLDSEANLITAYGSLALGLVDHPAFSTHYPPFQGKLEKPTPALAFLPCEAGTQFAVASLARSLQAPHPPEGVGSSASSDPAKPSFPHFRRILNSKNTPLPIFV